MVHLNKGVKIIQESMKDQKTRIQIINYIKESIEY